MNSMRELEAMDAAGVVGVFTDIDDTLTRDGRMPADAYSALEALHRAGLRIIPVTGRSAGWAHMALHLWPVDAVIAESGGLCLYRDADRRLQTLYHTAPESVRGHRQRLAEVAEAVTRAIPGLRPASDNAFRLVDFALDYCEEVERVPDALVARAVDMFRDAGFSARASTVHVNAWSGDFDKAPMALRYLAQVAGGAPANDRARWVFVGDAPNDVSMFEAFPLSVGVANIRRFAGALSTPPAFVTRGAFCEGFVELASYLLKARGA